MATPSPEPQQAAGEAGAERAGSAAGRRADPRPALWAYARRYRPELPERPSRALGPHLLAHDAETLCLVIDWAAGAPGRDARKLRARVVEGETEAASPAYLLHAQFLDDRIVQARRWELEGRPLAEDAQLPPDVVEARQRAARARQLAEDAARWPGWSPPPSWAGLPREYMSLHERAMQGQRMIDDGTGDYPMIGKKLLEHAAGLGWIADWPGPDVTQRCNVLSAARTGP